MSILETILYQIQRAYMNAKYWIRGKMGIKELSDDPIKAKWMIEKLKKHESYDESKVLSEDTIDDMLKDI
jgi:hypothetical protein